MSVLHIFGDSFAASKKAMWVDSNNPDKPWSIEDVCEGRAVRLWDKDNPIDYKEHLANLTGCETISDSPWTAIMGVSDEYMVNVVTQYFKHVKPDDYIVYASTDPMRELVLPSMPNHGNIANLHIKGFRDGLLFKQQPSELPKIKKQMQVAMEYGEYIQGDDFKRTCLSITYEARMLFLQNIFTELVGDNFIIVPGMSFNKEDGSRQTGFAIEDRPVWDKPRPWSPIHNKNFRIKGCLGHIGFMEMKNPNKYNLIMNHEKCWSGVDRRRNHMSPVNHKILADRLFKSITEQVDMDCMRGFQQGMIDQTNCWDKEFIPDPFEWNELETKRK